jgi:protein-S-isoprenylcysteine O-methyltransferase Ste14
MVEAQDQPKQRFNCRRFIGVLLDSPFFCCVFLFVPAGTLAWWKGWCFMTIFLIVETVIIVYLWHTNPALLVARSHVRTGPKRWDKILLAVMMPILLTIFPSAALDDRRLHWSAVSWRLSGIGYVLMLSGFWLATWAGRVNIFAEPTVQIQHDRGHHVIDTGPYVLVRHPMYTACIGLFPGMACALGSYWALLPAAVVCGILGLRTHWEDQTLQAELDGYQDYTTRVPDKLIPHVW